MNTLGPVTVIDSRYQGGVFNFTLGEETFQASPRTRPDYLWIKNCKFDNLKGGSSGAFYISRSNVYFSNTDSSLVRRLLSDS